MSSKIKKEPQELQEFRVEYRRYKTELTEKYKARKPWEPVDESKIVSFIPGTITELYVKEGDHVKEGQELMVLEAMKMKNLVFADRAGKILKMHITKGETVPKAKVRFELELD